MEGTESVIVYTHNERIIEEAKKFGEKHQMNFFIAEDETDLVAFGSWLKIIDINLIEGIFFNYLNSCLEKLSPEAEAELKLMYPEEDLSPEITEIIISHTKGNIPNELAEYIRVQEDITIDNLEKLLH